MKLSKAPVVFSVISAMFLVNHVRVLAQNQGRGPGTLDRGQFIERMMQRYQTELEFSDADWKVIRPRVARLIELRFSRGGLGRGAGFLGRGRAGRANRQGNRGGEGNRRRNRGFQRPASPAQEALRAAIQAGAPISEIKAKLEAYRKARQKKETEYKKAQEQLRQVLSVRQEAIAVLFGLLN